MGVGAMCIDQAVISACGTGRDSPSICPETWELASSQWLMLFLMVAVPLTTAWISNFLAKSQGMLGRLQEWTPPVTLLWDLALITCILG